MSFDIILLDGTDDSSNVGTSEGTQTQHDQQQPKMSKSQRKKRERMERYAAGKERRRRAKRERLKERKRAAKASGRTAAVGRSAKPTKVYTMNESKCRVRVAVDMAYDELMDERTVAKTVSQLRHCYAANRRATDPLQFYVVNLDGKAKKVLDGIVGWAQWDVHLLGQPLAQLWDDREIVYLTADSENVLSELDEQKVYVIGGLLDHNHRKGLCLRRATEKGYAHAKLPIGDFVRMSTRKVLAINHVFEILLHFARDPNWERAFLSVIPKRKLSQPNGAKVAELEATANAPVATGAANDGGDVLRLVEEDGRNNRPANQTQRNHSHRSDEDGTDRRAEKSRQGEAESESATCSD